MPSNGRIGRRGFAEDGTLRVLHILDHSIPLHSGYSFRTRAILEHQRRLGWETFQLTSPKHSLECPLEERVDGFDFYRSPAIHPIASKLPIVNQYATIGILSARLDEVTREVEPDILHAHSPALNGVAAMRVARRRGLPVVYECRAFWEDAAADHGTSKEWGMRYRMTRMLETHVLRRVDAVTTICEGLRREIVARGISQEKVTIVPNAVESNHHTVQREGDDALRARLGIKDVTVIGFIGSFYAYEGLSHLLGALPAVLEHVPRLRVLLVGGGPEEPELKRLAAALGVRDKVLFAGRVPHADVHRYYDLVDVFVYPRLPMRLTNLVTPLKPLEAMARKRIVVASDVGGHRELIRPGATGELFKAGDIASLTETLVDVLAHRERWGAMHDAGYLFVQSERSWGNSVARYQDVYATVLNLEAGYVQH